VSSVYRKIGGRNSGVGIMARVVFTSNLQRHIACPECEVRAATVSQALAAVFAESPQIRDYVLDEQGQLRKHVSIYVDGRRITDRERLSDAVAPASEICVLQALSGG
jgi:molybdopterin converting factor small subunit